MLAEGGVYSDIDTSCLVHPDRWIPIDLGAKTVNAIIGIEYDDHTYQMFVRPIGLCQWTLMAKPGHPIYELAIQRVMSNLQYIARRKRVNLNELTLDKMEVLEATGPGMITDVVLQVLQEQGQNVTWATLHDQKEPKLFGDVLILPINGFAGSQKHSHAGDPAYGEKYVQHHFGRSWYAPERAGGDADKTVSKSPDKTAATRV
jgi:mannosyltransferase OCH1-like enzyme